MSVSKRRLTFGLLVDWITALEGASYYQSRILEGVEDFTRENDINLICFAGGRLGAGQSGEDGSNVLFDFIDSSRIDGLIILAASIGINAGRDKIFELLNKYEGMPIVTLGEGFEGYPCVSTNNFDGMKQVVDHLIKNHNCRSIAFIKGAQGNSDAEARYEAYLGALRDNDIPFDHSLVYQGDFLYNSGVDAVRCFLDERNINFDAIAAANDDMAIGALKELNRNMDRLPGFIAVTGFDDAEASIYHSLTTVRQSFYDEARIAAGMLRDLIEGKSESSREECLPEIVLRSSCGCVLPVIKKVIEDSGSLAEEPFEIAIEGHRGHMAWELSSINQLVSSEIAQELCTWEQRILEAIYDEIYCEQKYRFLFVWNGVLTWASIKKISFQIITELLLLLRKSILLYIPDQPEVHTKLENMFHIAHLQIQEAIERKLKDESIEQYRRSANFEHLGEELITALKLEKQVELFKNIIPQYGVSQCYIALYENPGKFTHCSKLIMAYSKNHSFSMTPDDVSFPTKELLPKCIIKELEQSRFSHIIQALYIKNSYLGYAVFDNSVDTLKVIAILSHRLSIALNNSSLYEEMQKKTEFGG